MGADSIILSVIIPTYNNVALLIRTIKSLETQSLPEGSFEVIVVNDGSADGTADYLRSYSGPLNLRAVHLETNRGRSAARNRGASESKGDILLFIDGDLEFNSDFLTGHLNHHKSDGKVVTGRVVYPRELGRRGWARYLESRGAMKLSEDSFIPGRYLLSGNFSIPKAVFNAMDGFDEALNFYGEDIDFGKRIEKMGVEIKFDKRLVVRHLHLRDLNDVMKLMHEYGARSLKILFAKHPELRTELGLTWLDSDRFISRAAKFLLARPFYQIIFTITQLLNETWAPMLFYKYLLFNAYYNGYYNQIKRI